MQEDDLDTQPPHLFDQQDLLGIVPRQPIGRMDREPVDRPSNRRLPETLKCWADQRCATLAVVKKLQCRWHDEPIGGDPDVQGGDLARNRLGIGVVLGRPPGGNGHLDWRHNGDTPS